jgi:hypothetical protein
MKLEEAVVTIRRDLNDAKGEITSFTPETAEKIVDELDKVTLEVEEVIKWKSFIYVRSQMAKARHSNYKYILNIKDMIINNQLMSVSDAVKHLQINEQSFYDGIRGNVIDYIKFFRLRAETLIEGDYNGIRNLQSQDRIGEYGQRLPDLFAAIYKKYPYPEDALHQSIVNLLRAEDDIIAVIYTNISLAMKYQAMSDLLTYVFASMSTDFIKLLDEKVKTTKEINDLRLANQKIKADNKDLVDENSRLLRERARLLTPPKNEKDDEDDSDDDDTSNTDHSNSRVKSEKSEKPNGKNDADDEDDSDDDSNDDSDDDSDDDDIAAGE